MDAVAGIAREKSSGRIVKLVDGDVRGERELQFYQTVFHTERDEYHMLRKFVSLGNGPLMKLAVTLLSMFCTFCTMWSQLPEFYGLRTILNRKFIVLEDVSCGNNNVMDIKIGAITYDHLASEEKMDNERKKYPFGQELGFRLLGYRVRDMTVTFSPPTHPLPCFRSLTKREKPMS